MACWEFISLPEINDRLINSQHAILGMLGIYKPIVDFGQAGATVPLLGFGYNLWKGVKEAVDNQGFFGLFTGGFTASAVGISGSLVFAFLASLVCNSKIKK